MLSNLIYLVYLIFTICRIGFAAFYKSLVKMFNKISAIAWDIQQSVAICHSKSVTELATPTIDRHELERGERHVWIAFISIQNSHMQGYCDTTIKSSRITLSNSTICNQTDQATSSSLGFM